MPKINDFYPTLKRILLSIFKYVDVLHITLSNEGQGWSKRLQ